MTCSFHKFGEYFPGTGDLKDKGHGAGDGYAINVPLHDGMDDESYHSVFQPVIAKIMEKFQPGAVVLQCGADSLSGDRLGCFKLSIKGHAACVNYVKSFNIPTLVLGGGGYTLRNVPRCWAYETAVLLDTPVRDALPFNDYFEYYGPEYRLHLPVSNMQNLNSPLYLDSVRTQVLQILDTIEAAPGTQIFTGQDGTSQIPPAASLADTHVQTGRGGEGPSKATLDSDPTDHGSSSSGGAGRTDVDSSAGDVLNSTGVKPASASASAAARTKVSILAGSTGASTVPGVSESKATDGQRQPLPNGGAPSWQSGRASVSDTPSPPPPPTSRSRR